MAGIVFGRLAFVSGGGSGIGRATCNILAREGATVIAADRNHNAAKETIEQISKTAANANHSSLALDVSSQESISKALKEILEKFSRPPTIIVNSAGITKDNFLLKMSEMDFDQVINVNLKGTFLVMQNFAKALAEAELKGSIVNIASIVGKSGNMVMQNFAKALAEAELKGSIVNIASIVGKSGNMGQCNYSASKAGVEAMTRVASKEFGKFGIRVNAVLPGFIRSPMTETVPEKLRELVIAQSPMKRMGEPEEVAEVITFLASDRASFINGASIEVTGG